MVILYDRSILPKIDISNEQREFIDRTIERYSNFQALSSEVFHIRQILIKLPLTMKG